MIKIKQRRIQKDDLIIPNQFEQNIAQYIKEKSSFDHKTQYQRLYFTKWNRILY